MKNKYNIDNSYFIHFATKEECEIFKKYYLGRVGHTCCNGKGCKLLDVKDYKTIHQIKEKFVSEQQSQY